jgi:cell wall-associated NlpC family hydrolase
MDPETLELLRRSHQLFGLPAAPPELHGDDDPRLDKRLAGNAGLHGRGGHQQYVNDLTKMRETLRAAAGNDAELGKILGQLAADHAEGHRSTTEVLDAAAADTAPASDTSMGNREAIARKAVYLRHQHDTIRGAHARARHTTAALRALRYRRGHAHGISPDLLRRLPHTRGGNALKHALTQLGVDYVWGGTSPGKGLDCSSLMQYAWDRVGVHIPRTTWDQIHVGAAVSHSEVQPGDLVFPASAHGGHVQMYAGNGKVIEAPYTGAKVRITEMPNQIMAIRRPL